MASIDEIKLFTHGIEFLYPRTEDGPSLYALLEASWTLVALVQGIRTEVWEMKLDGPNPVAAAWAKMGLLEVVKEKCPPFMQLTPAGNRVVGCAGLLEYEFSMMQQQMSGNFVTDPAKYKDLRTGLDNYAREFLPDMQQWINQQVAFDGALMFDYCGGNGGYLFRFLAHWQQAQGLLFDRAPEFPASLVYGVAARAGVKAGDAFGEEQFFDNHAGAYDLVVMSEILHCKGPAERAFLLNRGKSLLKPGGAILVIEQYPNLRLEWRMHDMTEGGQTLDEAQVSMEASALGLLPISGIHSLSHYGIRFEVE